ncbi:GNAT family acetyltransferase [Aquabacter spiritensis]|uniref:N-acetyltransferase domain-containing protein n=1 Tax=Aquabacter spiritensis TaxID=933073 RepID=A0A4R3M2W3_9HYPH|nr:GNAT family acetyltransferase [Aquabacter spiritensis]TCT05597.1 hypothetical protein EDC64_104154 [Aquabacter spiritensis]
METGHAEPALGHMRDDDAEGLIALWHAAGLVRPWNDPRADIALARRGPHSSILVLRDQSGLAGSVMVGHDGHRGWIYYLAVRPDLLRRGLGRRLATAAEDWLAARGVPKLMLMVRPENAGVRGFYAALGYLDEPRIVFSKRLDQA